MLASASLPVLASAGSPRASKARSSAIGCASARGSVRTLSDARSKLVRFKPRATTVADLLALPRAAPGNRAPRGKGVETTTFKLRADLVGMRQGEDRGIQLAISQPGNPARTMVVEFPDPRCLAKRTPKKQTIRKARASLVSACGSARRDYAMLEGAATITGVGFRDAGRGKPPGAPNGIELSPVLALQRTRCRVKVAKLGTPSPGQTTSATGSATGAPPPPIPVPTWLPPPPDPNDRPCTDYLVGGSIGAQANAAANRVLCLQTAYFKEPAGSVTLITKPNVRVQRAPEARPVVCGRIIPAASGSSVATDLYEDPGCVTYFNESSPFNKVAAAYGPSVPTPASWYPDFDGIGTGPLQLSRGWDHGKAIFQAKPSDPVSAKFRVADASQCHNDPNGCAAWQPIDGDQFVQDENSPSADLIPIPSGVRCPGLPNVDDDHDRALAVVSADGKKVWEFWHCTHAATPSEPYYTAAIAARWSLDQADRTSVSSGYQNEGLTGIGSGSARASGMPLVATAIRPLEAIGGINHPVGLTVKRITTGYVNPPASHTDECPGCSHLEYGMLFVLDPSFPTPADATLGQINLIEALKKYGAFIVDRGPDFVVDGSPNEPSDPTLSDLEWADAGLDKDLNGLTITPSDLRYVPTPGSPPALP
jgi:hypothetical protein